MTVDNPSCWPRRTWLAQQAVLFVALPRHFIQRSPNRASMFARRSVSADLIARAAAQADRLDPAPWQVLAQQAVDAARTAGAHYADARLTRVIQHDYSGQGLNRMGGFSNNSEAVGVGIRALVDGYWGFSASASITPDEVVRLARDAVGQATDNAKGPPRTVDMGQYPVATGTWSTPIHVDPFTISIEEKLDHIGYWRQCFDQAGISLSHNGQGSWLRFVRLEWVVATSDGALFTQTCYESGGEFICIIPDGQGGARASYKVQGLDIAGAGWEMFQDDKILNQFPRIKEILAERAAIPSKPSTVGRYTLVCDGATMAALLEATLGVATQLDRALGYEANAGGTSFIDDPLAMVGHLPIAPPLVTVTANRTVPGALATVKWDAEGIEPEPFTLITDGVLTDFQTTREQAAWLAPYYHQHGQPVRSHGCAVAENAHVIPMQHMPNLVLQPSASAIRLEDLIADVPDGILVEGGQVLQMDFQARTGFLLGEMRQIKNGRAGSFLQGGAVEFDSQAIWKNLQAVGGASTQAMVSTTQFQKLGQFGVHESIQDHIFYGKGQPAQLTSHSVQAVAATVPNQPLIDPLRKA